MTGSSGCEPAGRTSLERPDWYADTPVKVEVTSLETFATAVREELEQNVAPYREKILQLLSGSGDTGGGGSRPSRSTVGTDAGAGGRASGASAEALIRSGRRTGFRGASPVRWAVSVDSGGEAATGAARPGPEGRRGPHGPVGMTDEMIKCWRPPGTL